MARINGSAKMIVAKPVMTARLTKKCPTHKPAIYRKPCRQPNAAPVPASDNTPGPGVMNIKITTIMKDNIYIP
jgi:hypothetical protein